MLFSSFALLAVAGLAATQSTKTTSSAASASTSGSQSCDAQNVLDLCIEQTSTNLASCLANDYQCLCQKADAKLQCYNVCPNDSGIGAASSAKTTYCNLSNQYPSTSSSAFSAATTTSSSASASGSNTASATDTNSGAVRTTGTGTGSSPTATKTNAAIAGAVVPAGGFVLALFGVLEAIL